MQHGAQWPSAAASELCFGFVQGFDLIRQRLFGERQAVRWYVGAMRRLPPPDEPLPDEVEALRDAEAEFARGGGRPLRAVLHDLECRPKQSG